MKKARKALFLTILVVIPLFTSCFLFDFLSPQTTSSRSKMVMTVTPQSPTYVGENMVVRISTSPSRRQEFIRLTITNLITGTSQVLEENEVSSAEFTFAAPASNFTVMAEIPGYEKRLGKEKDKSWSGLQDFTPPNVTLSVQREDPTKNIFLVEVSVDEPHSTITSVGYSLDGQTRSLDLSRVGARGVASAQVPMEIGQHVFQGFATNQSQKKGYSQNTYLEVAPPFSTNPPQIQLLSPSESEPFIDCFQDEMVTISANISDGTSYLEEVRVFSDAGIRRIFEFDPLQKEYFLNYRFRVSESQTVQIIAINGNGIEEDETVWVDMINHRAPQITLSGPEGETPAGTPLTYNFTVTAQDGVNLSEVYFLADNSTVRSFQSIGEPSFSGSVRYTVPKKDHFLKVVAIDEMGARGESDEIQITGIVEDNDPPEIQLFFPSVAYQGFDTDLGFTCRDTGSGLDGYPSILIEETEETFIPMTFDNQFFYTTWRPGTVGLITFTVSAIDKSGNQATRQSTIEVKDPTGVLLPTISNLGAFPNPVMMGNSVQINITIVPPAQGGGTTPVVQFEITSPTGANYSPTGITQTGNVHSATFFPVDEGVHSVVAHVQWGETSYSKSCTFQVLSPDPESDFSVYPTETYLGNMVTLTLNPYSSNPNANITVQSMTFAGRPLTPVIQQNNGTGIPMYVATTTTITDSTGTNVAFAKFTDNFGNAEERQAQVNLKTPVVTITGFNITPSVGSQPQAYNPIHFEVILDKSTLPSGIVPSGEITISELGDTPRAQVTIPLVQDASETNVLQSQTDWLPPKEGTYSLAAKAVLQVGAFSFSAQQEEIVEVFPAAIDITLDSSPVSLERITVGRQIDLEFSVFGIPASDTVHSFQYAIYHEDNIHVAPRTLEEDSLGKYTDKLDPFMEAGPYQIIATVTTIAPAVKTKTWDFSVLPSEIRKKVFKLDGNSQNLVFGQPMDFILELENPTKIENLGIKMFLVDENYNRIMNIDPIVARVQDDEVFSQFKNETPFLLYQEASFTIAASITIEEVPQINLPTAYGDTIYHMYAPKTQIAIDGSRKYYRGYAGSIDVTVTKPVSMEIQPPVMTLANPADGTLEPTPYSSSSTYPTVINYRYKITPQVAGNIGVQAQLFEKEDTNFQNPVAEASQTLAVEEFQPRVIITGTEGENEFIQAKAPTVLLEISDVPEFFEGQFQFKARLDGNPSTEFPVVSPNSSATAQFFSNHLFDKLGADVVEISAVANSIGNETFSADGTRTFGVRLPSISNSRFPDYVINKTYHAFSESTMTVLFNNNDRVTENIRVDLYVYNPLTNSTDTYNSALTLSENSVDASALFSGIVFPNDGDYRIMAKALGTNSNPVELLDQTDWATVSSSDIGSFVDIKYPFSGQEIFVGEPLRPKAVLTNIPNVLSVRFDIVDSTGATVVSNGRTAKNTDGDWELLQEDVAILSNTGPATVKVTVSSEDLADMTKENTFQVIAGHFDSVTIKRQSGGFLIFPGEDLTFQSDFTFDNLNAVTPSVQAVARLQPLETTNYTIQRISESEQLNGELRQFTHQWLGNDASAPMIPGQYILDFSGSFMGETMAASLSFTVVSKVDWPEITLSPEAVNPGDSVTAQVLFLVPPSVVTWMEDQNATFSDYFSCNLTLGGILYEAFSRIETVNPDGRIDYLVGITGIAPDVGEDPGDSKTFTATAQPIIDSDVGETTTKQFTVTQD